MKRILACLAVAWSLALSGCGYNTLQAKDEQVKASWAEVVNQYQRRADLVPNLVSTVKGEAKIRFCSRDGIETLPSTITPKEPGFVNNIEEE